MCSIGRCDNVYSQAYENNSARDVGLRKGGMVLTVLVCGRHCLVHSTYQLIDVADQLRVQPIREFQILLRASIAI